MNHKSVLELKNEVKGFCSENLTFKPILSSDIEVLRLWRNKEENRTKFIFDGIISSEQQINWYKSYETKNNDLMFIISENSSNISFATVSLYNIDFISSSAEFGRIMIGENDFRGKGLGSKITSAIVHYAFEKLKLTTVYLEVFSDNFAAIKTYEKVGFISSSELEIKNKSVIKMVIKK